MPEELMTADEIRAELEPQTPPSVLGHEEQAAEADIPEPREDRPPARQDPGSQLSPRVLRELSEGREARRELNELRQQMERLQGALDERIAPVQDFVAGQKQKDELAAELASAPEVGTPEHAEWVLQRANRAAVAPIQAQLDKTTQLIEGLAAKVSEREKQEQAILSEHQRHQTRIAALNFETSRLNEEQVQARDIYIQRRKAEFEASGEDAEQATMKAARELEGIYGQAFERHQELGHGGETLVQFMRHWGWLDGSNGRATAPAPAARMPAAASVDPDIARRQRLQAAESPPQAAPPAQPASGDASEREFIAHATELAKRSPTKFRRELVKRAKRRGISEDEYEQRFLIPDAPE